MMSSRPVRATTAMLLLVVAAVVVVVPTTGLWSPPGGVAAVLADEGAAEVSPAQAHRSDVSVAASEALPHKGGPSTWWLFVLPVLAPTAPVVVRSWLARRLRFRPTGRAPRRDAWCTRAPPLQPVPSVG